MRKRSISENRMKNKKKKSLTNEIVARSKMGNAYYLFNHQVGGHQPLLRSIPGEVCKPYIEHEALFYKNIQTKLQNLKQFVPRCIDKIKIHLPQEKDGLYQDSSKESNFDKRVQPAAFSHRLWEKFSKKENKTHGNEYLVLEDLTHGYHRPCVLDIKMGSRQHGIDATPEKITSQMSKCKATTSFDTGMRLCGMQVYQNGDGQYLLKDKHWGRSLKKADLIPALSLFVRNGEHVRRTVLKKLIQRLELLKNTLNEMNGIRFWGASLLLLYEGDGKDDKASKVDVRIIDFAHWYQDQTMKTPDEGYLKGLHNLIQLFQKIYDKKTSPMDDAAVTDSGCYLDIFTDE